MDKGTSVSVLADGTNYTGLVDEAHTTVLFSVNPGTGVKKTIQVFVAGQISIPVVAFNYQGKCICFIPEVT